MNLLKLPVLVLVLVGLPLAVVSDTPLIVLAQEVLAPPIDVSVMDGNGAGEVIVRWTPIEEAAYYRIGWVAYDDYYAVRDSGRDWLEAFVFVDVQNRDQSEHLVTRLRPGVRYAFILASNASRYGVPSWSSWASHTLAQGPVKVGASGLATPDWIASSGGLRLGTVDLSWSRVAGATSFLVWYSSTNGDDHRWAWADNQSTTVVDLEPGLVYRFAVAAAKTDAEGNFVYSPFSNGVTVRATWDANVAQSSGMFSEVTMGDNHSCGLSVTGAVQCWGANMYGQLNAPLGRFVSVQAGSYHTCALRTDGSVVCWGNAGDEGKTSPPDETFTQIAVGSQHGCGLTAASTITCWGRNRFGEGSPPEGTFLAVSASKNIRGVAHSCGVRTDGSAVCWGDDYGRGLYAPGGVLTGIWSGDLHNCGLDSEGALVCAGSNQYGQIEVPAGAYSAVSVGASYTCGLRTDGSAICWGGRELLGETVVPEGIYTSVSAGYQHTCGIKTNGRVLCWGNNEHGQSSPP